MDHLPLPHTAHHIPAVPFLSGKDYDGGPFLEYPKREDWTLESLCKTGVFSRSSIEKGGFLQTWLIFGMLHAITDRPVDRDLFVLQPENSPLKFLTMASLKDILQEWATKERSLLADEKNERQRAISSYLAESNSILWSLPADAIDPTIRMSLAIFGEILTRALGDIYQVHSLMLIWIPKRDANLFMRNDENIDTCPSDLTLRSEKFSATSMFFISHLDEPETAKGHGQCTKSRCFGNQVSEDSYETFHAEGCPGTCKMHEANQNKMLDFLRRGNIPLARYTDTSAEGEPKLDIIECSAGTAYTAISHVWSQGLGNNKANALPHCQLSYLSGVVQSATNYASENALFWIDTICFPLEPPEAYDLAMGKMRQTYEDAETVLTLDSYLKRSATSSMTRIEQLFRIFCCGWQRRLWTFQEGALAKKLLFQFSDVAVDLDALVEEAVFLSGFDFCAQPMLDDLAQMYLELRNFKTRLIDRDPIAIINRGLMFRATSVDTDEALCIGVLLDLDMEKILEVPPTDRMKRAWELQTNISAAVAFTNGPRSTGWAPASFLGIENCGTLPAGPEVPVGNRTDSGLEFRLPGFLLTCPRQPSGNIIAFQDDEQMWYQMITADEDSFQNIQCPEERPASLALVSQAPIAQAGQFGMRISGAAFLAAVERAEDSIVAVRFICNIGVARVNPRESAVLEAAEARAIQRSDWATLLPIDYIAPAEVFEGYTRRSCGVSAKRVPEDQKWCVM